MGAGSASRRGRVRVEPSPKRVRVSFAGEYIADSQRAQLVWEHPRYPYYYFPASDVRTDLLVATGEERRSPSRGTAEVHTVRVGEREAAEAALWYRGAEIEALVDHLKLEWDAMDAWFEEEEEIFVHPRDPYTRIDVLQSARRVRIEVDGVTVAESRQPRILFETGLPPRFYLPKTDLRMELLRPSQSHTECPYKGTASYYDLTVNGTTHEDFVWWYPTATPEAARVAGYACFFNERVDLYLDGNLQERPRTHFS